MTAEWVPLSAVVAAGAFAGTSSRARAAKAARWAAGELAPALAEKRSGEWFVSPDARLNEVSTSPQTTVKAFLICGVGSEALGGHRVPPDALNRWGEKDRERNVDTWELIRRFDECRAQFPKLTRREFDRIFFARHGAWAESKGLKTASSTIDRYRRRLDPNSGCGFDGNVDRRGRRPASEEERAARCSPEAWETFLGYYHTQRKLTVRECYDLVAAEAPVKGWAWPSLRTIQLRVQRLPRAPLVLAREGPRKFEADCLPKIQRDYESVPPGTWWCLDGRSLDIMGREPDARTGWRRCRFVIVGVLDCRTRKLIGWAIGTVEHSDLIMASLKMALQASGAPEHVIQDNGEAFKAVAGRKAATISWDDPRLGTLYGQLNVTRHDSIPYAPWAKMIESIWKLFKEDFDRHFWSFWGGRPGERPEAADKLTRERIDQLPTLDDIRRSFAEYLEVYHSKTQGGSGMFGLSPNLVDEQYRETIRRVDPAIVDLICTRLVGPVRVTKNGVRWNNLLYGHFDEAVWALFGQQVWLRIDPADSSRVTLCDNKGVPICEATNAKLTGADQEDVRMAARKRAKMRKVAKGYAEARDYLMSSTPDQILELKHKRAKAVEADLRKNLPAPMAPAEITIVRPDLAEAAQRLGKAAVRRAAGDDPFADLARANRPAVPEQRQPEDMGQLFRKFAFSQPEAGEPENPPADDWSVFSREVKQGRDALAGG